MQTLDDFDRDLFENTYRNERWIYATRSEGDLYALGLVMVGRRDMVKLPTCCCWSESFSEMRNYVDFLNQERLARTQGPIPNAVMKDDDTTTEDDGDQKDRGDEEAA